MTYENKVFQIESILMGGGTVNDELLAQVPAAYVQKSPILLKAQGELFMKRGALAEAREVLLTAVQGFARQTFQAMLLDALALLAMVNLRLAEWQDTRTILHFLREEWLRKESPVSGRVLQSLAWGNYLLDEVGEEETYFREAWAQFRNDGDNQGIADLCLDLLLHWGSEMSEKERGKIYYFVEQKVKLDPSYQPLYQLVSGLLSRDQLQWSLAITAFENLDTSLMSYHHAALCLVRHVETRLKANFAEDQALWDKLNKIQHTYGSDLILQFQLGVLQYTRAERGGQSEQAEALLFKLMAWQELTGNPHHGEWLQWVQMKKENAVAKRGEMDGWEIRCFGEMSFSRTGTEIKGIKWKRKKALELFIYLLIQPEYAAPKEQIMESLLGQGYADKMNNQLYVILHQLKQTLKQELHLEPNVIIKDGIIRLHKGQIQSLDLEQYRNYIQQADQLWSKDQVKAMEYYEQAYPLYGDFMPEIRYIDWVEAYREALADTQATVLRKLAHYYRQLGQKDQAEIFYSQWIELRPTDEEGYLDYIEYLVETGRKQEAKRMRKKWDKLISEEQETVSFEELKKHTSL
jgi:two-component SAPR family response regulator